MGGEEGDKEKEEKKLSEVHMREIACGAFHVNSTMEMPDALGTIFNPRYKAKPPPCLKPGLDLV